MSISLVWDGKGNSFLNGNGTRWESGSPLAEIFGPGVGGSTVGSHLIAALGGDVTPKARSQNR